jgi:hypothetical protein
MPNLKLPEQAVCASTNRAGTGNNVVLVQAKHLQFIPIQKLLKSADRFVHETHGEKFHNGACHWNYHPAAG